MRNIFKKINTRKGILILFAFSTMMPFLSIIGANLSTKLSDIFKVDAADIVDILDNLPDPAGYVSAPNENQMYYDRANKTMYSTSILKSPTEYVVSATVYLNKKSSKSIEATYHLENYTAIKDIDFVVPEVQKVVIAPYATSVNIDFAVNPSDFSVGVENSNFYNTRAFRFVLDSLIDGDGKEYQIYDGSDNGYKMVSGKLCKNELLCVCPAKYTYTTMNQYENGTAGSGLKVFTDYYDFQKQTYGVGEGSIENNTYDLGGKPQKHSNGEYYRMDEEPVGRLYGTDFFADSAKGAMRMCPAQTNNYYDPALKRQVGPYRNWLNRIVLTNLGHSYGSFNVMHNGSGNPSKNYVQSFFLGDYSFVTKDPETFGRWSFFTDPNAAAKFNKDHYSWGINLRLNEANKPNWFVTEVDLERHKDYMNRVINGDEKIDAKEHILAGYSWSELCHLNMADEVKKITVLDYNKVVTESFIPSNDKKICWFPLVGSNTPETFGFNLFFQQFGTWYWHGPKGFKGQTFFTVLDDVVPTIQNSTYIETGSLTKNGKIRMSVRFSEPIQAFEHSYFTADAGNGIKLTFRPVAGQLPGCDTVVYETDTSNLLDVLINEITIDSEILYDEVAPGQSPFMYKIRDYAQGGGHELPTKDTNHYLYGRRFTVNINKKLPVVLPAPGAISKDPKQNATAQITISYVSDGDVYYTFIKDEGHDKVIPTFSKEEVSNDKVYSNSIKVTSAQNNAQVNLDLPSSPQRTGNYYCFVKVVTNFGVEKTYPENIEHGTEITNGIGPFNIDNTKPVIKVLKDPTTFNSMERKFNIQVTENCSVDKITVKLNKTQGQLSEQINEFDVAVNESTPGSGVYEGSFSLTLQSILDKYYTIKETGKHVFNPDLEYEDFSFSFSAVDKAGNQTNSFIWNDEERNTPIILPFSSHEYIPVEVKAISKAKVIDSIPNLDLYPIGTSFTFQTNIAPETIGPLEASVVKLPKATSNREFYASYNNELSGINISQGDPAENNKSVVTLNKPGYYEIVIRNSEGNCSDVFRYHITDNLKERTANYVNAMESTTLVPKNSAWQLNDTSRMYYLDQNASYHSVAYEGINDPLFSSTNAAKNYVRGHEYQDLYLVQINMEIANYLNGSGGVSGYQRANLESTVAREGQYWVRYKNSNWSIESTSSTSWGYYFYCEPTSSDVSIDLDTISKNRVLYNQIEKVADILSKNGKTIYLVDDDHIDSKTGAPKLTAGQLAATKEFVITQTFTNSPVNSIVCKGDSDMYANFVTVNNGEGFETYRLATNLPLVVNDDTTLYARLAIGDTPYVKLNCKNGTSLKEALNVEGIAGSGIYKILEINSDGANEFEVYVDKENPYIEVQRTIYDPAQGTTVSTTTKINGTIPVDFYSKQFQINGYPAEEQELEVDDYAYVAVFKRNVLYTFAYINQLNGSPIVLPDGVYDVVVGDRSGNRYTFRTFISGSDIDVSFKVNGDNSKLTIEVTNREESELLKFDTYCNEELLESDLTNPKVYTLSGTYYAVVQDQYGNKIKTESFRFTKAMPEIKLYYIEDGWPYPYREGEENPHIILTVGEESMVIKTCSLLRITYDPLTTGIYVDNCPSEYYQNNTASGVLTFNEACNCTFYVYYLNNYEDYVKYEVIFDNTEPTISGKYNVPVFEKEDLNPSNFSMITNTPNSIDYYISTLAGGGQLTKEVQVTYGSTIAADFINFTVSDNTKVKSVIVTRDGVDVPVEFLEQGFSGYEFMLQGLPGHYVVVAYDIFNKATSLEFDIDNSDFSKATIDGIEVSPVGPLNDSAHTVLYGNTGATIVCDAGSIIVIRYEDKDFTYAIRIVCNGSDTYYTTYLISDESGELLVTDSGNPVEIPELPYSPFEYVDLTISMDKNGVITIDYVAGSSKSNLDVRVERKDEAINLYNMEFSKAISQPVFTDNGSEIEPINHYVYASKEARISDPTGDIVKIYIAYNPLEESFDENSYVEYTSDYKFANGFYSYIIVNKYGVRDQYIAVISDEFAVTVTLNYFEKDAEVYSIKYGDTFTSNKTITVVGYNIASMSEEGGHGDVIVEDGKTSVVFTQPGTYYLNIVDKYNNRARLTLIINSTGMTYCEEWLTGYNENALLKNQGYTNQTLSINLTEEQAIENGITQIFYIYNDERHMLYGYNGENTDLPFNPEALKNVIGSLGDGIYRVYFSNKYGDVCVKEIHYQVATTLNIERTTTASAEPDSISISDALSNGVWSNSKVNLSTTLNEGQYEFYVKIENSDKYEKQNINYLFELVNSATSGEIHYTVKYIDAYGNVYEFTVNLLRRQLSFNKTNVKIENVDDATYTKENFYIDFDTNDVVVVYRLNGGEYVRYNAKDIIFKDGLYEFYMYDKAGNQTSFVITKDSIVTFQVKVDGEIQNIYSGAAFNGETVLISSTQAENVTLVSAKLNGSKLDSSDLQFNKTGFYELLLKDKIGNISYFSFYLVGHELNAFEYTTANDYVVSAAYFVNADGIKVTCMNKVTENGTHIDLTNAEEGLYEFQIKNKYDNSIIVLSILIDKKIPTVELDGCKDGEVTTQDISLSKLSNGDVVTVYRDGKIVQQVEISSKGNIETITEGGKYRIVVQNKAGTTVEFNFEKLTIANGALSALIIVGLLAVSGSFFAVLLLRNRAKNDD